MQRDVEAERGPMPMTIVKIPTSVPSSANEREAGAITRLERGAATLAKSAVMRRGSPAAAVVNSLSETNTAARRWRRRSLHTARDDDT
jgi:hypothetical protein